MEIKDYLKNIGIAVEDNDEAQAFLSKNHIVSFLSREWNENREINQDNPESLNVDSECDTETLKNNQPEAENTSNSDEMSIFSRDNLPIDEDGKERARDEAFQNLVRSKQLIVQNGKVGQPYHFQIADDLIESAQLGDFWFENIDVFGLSYNNETHSIEGVPSQAGDYKIKWYYKHRSWDETKEALFHDVTIVINPDPRSLWNNIPTSRDIPFYKADSDQRLLLVPADKNFFGRDKKRKKDMVAASQRGRSHAHEGKARDDDFGLHFDEGTEWYTMVVADGAGSAKYSRRGAQIVCETVIDTCSNLLIESDKALCNLVANYKKESSPENRKDIGDAIYKILGSAVFKSYKNIETEANDSNSQVKDFATTLLVSICKQFKFGWFVASFWVGDGGIAIYQKDTDYLKVLGESDGGEFAGQTRFLTMPEIVQPGEIYRRLRFEIIEDFTALILMTDGITDPKFETDANLLRKEKWDNLWEDITSEVNLSEDNEGAGAELLNWLDFWSQGNHDDRTIAILF